MKSAKWKIIAISLSNLFVLIRFSVNISWRKQTTNEFLSRLHPLSFNPFCVSRLMTQSAIKKFAAENLISGRWQFLGTSVGVSVYVAKHKMVPTHFSWHFIEAYFSQIKRKLLFHNLNEIKAELIKHSRQMAQKTCFHIHRALKFIHICGLETEKKAEKIN